MQIIDIKKLLILTTIFLAIGSANAQTNINVETFTIKSNKDLPSWFDQVERTYMLNDDRIIEIEIVEFIGGYVPNEGEIFFINNTEVIFPENEIIIDKKGSVITKILSSGKYIIKIIWDTELTTGAYSEGKIYLYIDNVSVFSSPLIISGW